MVEHTKVENQLPSKINVIKFPQNTKKYYELTPKQDWVRELLLELNEKADGKSPEEYLEDSNLQVELKIKKNFNKEFGDLLLVKLNLTTQFHTQCIRTLENMEDSLEVSVNTCFMDKKNESNEELSEELEIYEDQEVHELYFYEKGFADLKEMIHEQIYLNINQYPVKDAETPLNWGKQAPDTKQ